jgi:2-methylisocitrate lyase-like PEP mutase family enzyme
MAELTDLAGRLRDLHRPGDPLVLVNAWDVASAAHVVGAGGRAIATSSAAIAASLGIPDGPEAPVDDIFDVIARIAGAVGVPVTADLLDGYGLSADDLIARLLAAGAVGCNLEDSDHADPGHLVAPDTAATLLSNVRAAASRAGVDIVLNARIDCFLQVDADPDDAVSEVVERARLYLDAGADCVYPIRLFDPAMAREIVDAVGAPVNANWSPEVSLSDLTSAGVRRISLGPTAQRIALGALDALASKLLQPS